MRRRLLPLVLVSLMLTSSMSSVLGASGREVVDNWDDGDAWVEISLISWVANQTEEWDSSGGLPDPQFRICFDVDGEDLDCVNTPTWENQWELNATWNYTIDIPDTSNLLNITIECEDNDAFNDDECDMNADVNEWKLYAEYNWSQNPNMTISGNGDGDGNGTWKNAASVWEVKIFGFGDEDGDGVPDNIDKCEGTNEQSKLLPSQPGCTWNQLDTDLDGTPNIDDPYPTIFALNGIHFHGADALSWTERTTLYDVMVGHTIQLKNVDHAEIKLTDYDANGVLDFRWKGHSTTFDIDHDGNLDTVSLGSSEFQIYFNYLSSTDDILSLSIDEYCFGYTGCITTFADLGRDGVIDLISSKGIFTFNGSGFDKIIDLSFCGGFYGYSPSVLYEPSSGRDVVDCSQAGSRRMIYIDNNELIQTITYTTNATCTDSNDVCLWDDIGGITDINLDGYVDLIRSESGNYCSVHLGGIDGIAETPILLPMGDNPTACNGPLSFSDMDLNGEIDIVTSEYILFQDDGEFVATYYPGWRGGFLPKIGDWDGDGDLDIIYYEKPSSLSSGVKVNVALNPSIVDSDSDGVPDDIDNCENTIYGEVVDANGCSDSQIDTDADGISDATDQCPNTPLGYPVDLEGCAPNQLDSDGDGISDAMDLCPTTPAGESINLEGCSQSEVDSDADGVVNSNDACPGTAQGSVVDANGCSESDVVDNDADGDGVVDTYDACPSTTSLVQRWTKPAVPTLSWTSTVTACQTPETSVLEPLAGLK